MRNVGTLLLLASAGGSSCHNRSSRSSAAKPASVTYGIERQELVRDTPVSGNLYRMALHVTSLRIVPQTISMHTTDTVQLDSVVRLFALDSTGAVLGNVPVYDTKMSPGAAVLAPLGRVVGVRSGTNQLLITFPRLLWHGRSGQPPSARIRIEVHD